MKKFFIAAIALLVAGNAMALDFEPKPGLSWQGTLGFNISSITNSELNSKIGINLGLKADYMLPNAHGTYISGGLEWTQKGAKAEKTINTYAGTHKVNEHYISIPLRVGFRYNITKDWGVYGELGPYFSLGLGGFNKFEVDADGTIAKANNWSYSTFKKRSYDTSTPAVNENASFTNGGLQRFDSGLGLRIGGEYMEQYSLNLGFDWGFTDLLRDKYRDAYADATSGELSKYKNFNVSLTVGYRF